jgi:ubiquinone/menaquinone biosynthesis C-methylase UbiE
MDSWSRIKKTLRRTIPFIGVISDFVYPFRERIRVWFRMNFIRQRAYPKNYFERLFETRDDPWKYEGGHQQERLHLLQSVIPQSEELTLEIGCAEGHFTGMLTSRCKHVVAMDLSLLALKRAQSRMDDRSNVTFIEADLLHLPFQRGFHTIVCAGVLVYFTEKGLFEQAVSQICRVLAPGGFLILENMWEKSAGNLKGQFIHDHFCSMESLELIQNIKRKEYGISVFQRKPLV